MPYLTIGLGMWWLSVWQSWRKLSCCCCCIQISCLHFSESTNAQKLGNKSWSPRVATLWFAPPPASDSCRRHSLSHFLIFPYFLDRSTVVTLISEWCCNHSFCTFKHLRVKSRANIGKSCLLRGPADVVSVIEVLKVRFGVHSVLSSDFV